MADRFPLIANTSTNQIAEIPSGDQLNLSGNNIANAGIVTATTFVGNLTGNPTGTLQTAAQPNITSVGTLSSLNVSGSVSIGATLTYEDVTNIDSVGLITARNGISVSSGGLKVLAGGSNFNATITGTATTATTITVSSESSDALCFPVFTTTGVGNNAPKVNTSRLSFNSSTGQLTATSFAGSGSGLTGIPAAQLSGTLPAIDGSNLTGIDASAITTGTTKVQTAATSIVNQISGAGIATITAQGLNVTGIITATSMKVFSSGIDYQWQGGTATAWWRSEDMVNETSWPAAKGGGDANFINGNGGSNGISYISSDSTFNNQKTMSMSSGGNGSLRTYNENQNQWWNGTEAFTMLLAMRKDAHHSGGSLGDGFFCFNYNVASSGSNVGGWSLDMAGDHTWGGQYGEMFGNTIGLFEDNLMQFSYPVKGILMVRSLANFDYCELSANVGNGWHSLEMRHSGPSSLPSNNFRSLSVLNFACEASSSHNAEGRVAECAYFKGKRLGGNELETITRTWCEKFNF